MSTLDDTRWSLVANRAPADFLYAVATMGIYCKPGCPSPRPRRENVRYFANTGEAEQAGFRACRRCEPASCSPRSACSCKPRTTTACSTAI